MVAVIGSLSLKLDANDICQFLCNSFDTMTIHHLDLDSHMILFMFVTIFSQSGTYRLQDSLSAKSF
jgi:hypothetical protein